MKTIVITFLVMSGAVACCKSIADVIMSHGCTCGMHAAAPELEHAVMLHNTADGDLISMRDPRRAPDPTAAPSNTTLKGR